LVTEGTAGASHPDRREHEVVCQWERSVQAPPDAGGFDPNALYFTAGEAEAYAETGGNMVAVMEIPREQTRRYGVLDVVSDSGKLVRAKGVVEKPEPAVAPSTLMIIGRYIIQPEIFGHLGDVKPGAGGEIQLTDGLDRLITDGQPFHGLRATARRYDCGEKLGYLEANIALGLQHPELGGALRRVLQSYL